MNFTVEWVPEAENQLTAIWLAARDRNAVTRAAHRIDQLFRSNPLQYGESREGTDRIMFEPPLGVL